jgi:hypothetical protein
MSSDNEKESGYEIDISHWGRMARWELEEAVVLALGRDPDSVSRNDLKNDTESDFGKQFAKAYRLAQRAREHATFYFPINPCDFVEWARTIECPFPENLAAEVIKASPDHINYRSKYEPLLAEHEAALKEIERLRTQPAEPPQEKGLSSKERATALKLIIGMAIKGYSFDPAAARSGTASEIASDLHELGMSIDEDTVRKWIKDAAAEILPGDSSQEDR